MIKNNKKKGIVDWKKSEKIKLIKYSFNSSFDIIIFQIYNFHWIKLTIFLRNFTLFWIRNGYSKNFITHT